jgi:hypothetical protein
MMLTADAENASYLEVAARRNADPTAPKSKLTIQNGLLFNESLPRQLEKCRQPRRTAS